MKKLATAFALTVLTAATALPAPAMAQSFRQRDNVISEYCLTHPRDRDCRDWRDNRSRWNESRYDRWYNDHNNGLGSFAAGIFGFALGATVFNGLSNGSRSGSSWERHVDRCEDAYRSYNPRTDMFLGYDGDYHVCRL